MKFLTPPLEAMPVRCAGCAFTAGTEANTDSMTQMTVALCLLSGEPFLCHANADAADTIPDGQERFCRGFVEAFACRGPVPLWKQAIAQEALTIMDEARTGNYALDAEQFSERILAAGKAAL